MSVGLKPFPKHCGEIHRSLLRLAPVLLLVVAGCGWQPLYARPTADPTSGGVTATFATIAIDPISTPGSLDPLTGDPTEPYDSRAAQLLQNQLRDALNPYGQPSPAAYHLNIKLTHELYRTAALGNGDSTREDLALTARYELTDEKGGRVLRDSARIVTSYDVLKEPFSDLQSQNDAVQRGVEQLAQAIQTRLATFLRK
jgi:hypothetical protein